MCFSAGRFVGLVGGDTAGSLGCCQTLAPFGLKGLFSLAPQPRRQLKRLKKTSETLTSTQRRTWAYFKIVTTSGLKQTQSKHYRVTEGCDVCHSAKRLLANLHSLSLSRFLLPCPLWDKLIAKLGVVFEVLPLKSQCYSTALVVVML